MPHQKEEKVTPTLTLLAEQHFAHLPRSQRVPALVGLLDTLNNETLRMARIERHAKDSMSGAELSGDPSPAATS